MARIRTIKPEFWDDLKISKLSRDARLLYIGMWNFSDDLGVVIGDSLWIKSKVFPFDQIQIQQFDKWITELVKSGFISLFSHNGEEFYYLPNLTRHQVINRPNLDKVNVQRSDLMDITKSLINHGIINDDSYSGKERKGVGKEEDKPPIVPLPGDGDSSFDEFWELYDKKVGDKERLRRKWDCLSRSDKQKVFEYIPLYKQAQPDKQYRKNPSTFLNQKSWDDELIFREQETKKPKNRWSLAQ